MKIGAVTTVNERFKLKGRERKDQDRILIKVIWVKP